MTNGDRVHKISLSSDSSEDEGDKDHTDQGPPAPEAVGAPVVAPMPFVIHPLLPTNTIFLNPFWTFHVADHYMVPLLGQQSPIASTTGPHLPGLLTTSESIEYQDHAGDEQQCNISNTDEPFPVKLHQMMSDSSCSEIISWMPHGRSWKIRDTVLLETAVLPKYFKHTRFASFMRQVNGWGFRRFPLGSLDHRSYYHELFLRGRPHLCHDMKRSRGKLKPILNIDHPDFYSLSLFLPLPEVSPAALAPLTIADSFSEKDLSMKPTSLRAHTRCLLSSDKKRTSRKRRQKFQSNRPISHVNEDNDPEGTIEIPTQQWSSSILDTNPKTSSLHVSINTLQNFANSESVASNSSDFRESGTSMDFGNKDSSFDTLWRGSTITSKDPPSNNSMCNQDKDEISFPKIPIPSPGILSVACESGNPYEGLAQLAPFFAAHDLLEPVSAAQPFPGPGIPLSHIPQAFFSFSQPQPRVLPAIVPTSQSSGMAQMMPMHQGVVRNPMQFPTPPPFLPLSAPTWMQQQPLSQAQEQSISTNLLYPHLNSPRNYLSTSWPGVQQQFLAGQTQRPTLNPDALHFDQPEMDFSEWKHEESNSDKTTESSEGNNGRFIN